MNNFEDLSFLFTNSPFIKIGIAKFEIVTGIKVVYQWNFLKNDENFFSQTTVDDIFKMILCNVHRQDEKYFRDCKISKIELQQEGFYIISSIFLANINQKNDYISLGIIMKSSEYINNIYLNNLLNSNLKSLSYLLKNLIVDLKPYSSFTPYIKDFSTTAINIILSMNKFKNNENAKSTSSSTEILTDTNQNSCQHNLTNSIATSDQKTIIRNEKIKKINYNLALETDTVCDFSDINFSFLALLLTSHIQTQMVTVIECQSIKIAHIIAIFLDRFLVHGQREMSSLEIHETVIPGLFLQFVNQQKTARSKMMSMINRPTTWARLSDQTIEQIIPISNKNKSNHLSSHFDQISIKTPAPWACKTVQLVQQAPTKMQKIICDIQMKDIIWSAASYSILARSIPQTQAQLLKPWTWSLFTEKSLPGLPLNVLGPSNLSHEEDLKLVASIAQLFDQGLVVPKST